MARGSIVTKGGEGTFEGIGVDTRALQSQLKELMKQVSDLKTQKTIHRKVGNEYKKVMKKNIKDAKEVFRIRRGARKGKPYAMDIPIGTLRRSVKVWLINNQNSTFWVGPKVGRRQAVESDGWFANIVEGDDQFVKGNNRNKGVFEESIKKATPAAFKKMQELYKAEIERTVKATKK